MRVLLAAWDFPPHAVGGDAAHVDGFARALGRAGHDVVVLTARQPGTAPIEQRDPNVRVLRATSTCPGYPTTSSSGGAASANHHLVQLSSTFGRWSPEVVHAHSWPVAWAADTLAVLHGAALVTTFHNTASSRHGGRVPPGPRLRSTPSSRGWRTAPARCWRRRASWRREVISAFEVNPDKVHRIPNGIDPEWWATGEHHDSRAPLVLTWGHVQFEKGFQVLARAMTPLRSRVPGIECIVAGHGSYLPEFQSRIDVEGVSDIVRLVGFVPDEKLRDLVHRAGCVVIPSLYEPFGIVALEALAGGAPLIAARTGGLAELIEDTGAGMLFDPGNADELAGCIEQVLSDRGLSPTGCADAVRRCSPPATRGRRSPTRRSGCTAAPPPADTEDALTPA